MKRALMMFFMIVIAIMMVGCSNENNVGYFYTLEDAYNKGLLSKDDLENIAYYYNELKNNDFKPKQKEPKNIDKETEKLIKKMYLEKILNDKNINIDVVNLYNYYGTYNGNIAISITDDYYVYDYICHDEYIIDGVVFYNFHEAYIKIFTFEETE